MNGHPKPLGRNERDTDEHLKAYPLRPEDVDELVALPTNECVAIGINWYTGSDEPHKGRDGLYRIKMRHGELRGGHCLAIEAIGCPDPERSWAWYDQGVEGACEGFGHARVVSVKRGGALLDAFWLYDDAQRKEGSYEPDGESADLGATNRGACRALKAWGVHRADHEYPVGAVPEVIERVPWKEHVQGFGITAYRWARDMDSILKVLGFADANEVPLLNSWGKDGYPHRVYASVDDLDHLIFREDGEASVLYLP